MAPARDGETSALSCMATEVSLVLSVASIASSDATRIFLMLLDACLMLETTWSFALSPCPDPSRSRPSSQASVAMVRDLFRDKKQTQFVIATIATTLGMNESARLAGALRKESVPCRRIIVNQVHDPQSLALFAPARQQASGWWGRSCMQSIHYIIFN